MDTENGAISLAGGQVISYDKCLLATGGRPKSLPVFDEAEAKVKRHVSTYREVRQTATDWGVCQWVWSAADTRLPDP